MTWPAPPVNREGLSSACYPRRAKAREEVSSRARQARGTLKLAARNNSRYPGAQDKVATPKLFWIYDGRPPENGGWKGKREGSFGGQGLPGTGFNERRGGHVRMRKSSFLALASHFFGGPNKIEDLGLGNRKCLFADWRL